MNPEANTERLPGYPAWSEGSNPNPPDQRRLNQAWADLAVLPDLVDDLKRCLTERVPVDGSSSRGKPGSRPPLRLEVLHLVDDRRKPGWDGEDPRVSDLGDRYGVAATLESWTRVVVEEMAEPPELAEQATVRTEVAVLVECWDWICEQQWAEELADKVISLTRQVRAGLGQRKEYRPLCRKCRNVVEPVDPAHRSAPWELCAYGLCTGCGETYPPGPALRALGQVQAPMPLKEVSKALGIPLRKLQRRAEQGVIKPDRSSGPRGRLFDLAEVRERLSKIRDDERAG